MIVRTTRTVFEIAAASFLGVLLLTGIAAWRLAQGPVPLEFLTPHLERALNGQGAPFRISLAGTNLAWAGWQRTLDIRVVDVRATADNGKEIARVPEMSVSLSLAALFRGVIAPRSLDLIGARLRLVRRPTGQFALSFGAAAEDAGDGSKPDLFARVLSIFGATSDVDRPITYLRRISILDAGLEIDDRLTGAVWGAPRADVVLLREEGEIRGTFFAELDIGGAPMKVNGAASWRPTADVVRVETELTGARIDRIARKIPGFEAAEAVLLEVNGRVALTMSLDGAVHAARFDLAAGSGEIAASKLWPEGVPVTSVRVRGNLNKGPDRLEIEEFFADLGGPKLSGRISGIGMDDAGTLDGHLTIDRMSLSDLDRYWPQKLGSLVRNWVLSNMPAGIVEDAQTTFSLAIPGQGGGSPEIRAMSGTLRLRDTEIHYLKGLPPVRSVVAHAAFSLDRFIADVRSGRTEGLKVTSGSVRLTKLDTNIQQADIDVSVSGPLARALSLVDRPPLGFVSRFGLSPSNVKGQSETQLTISLPMDRNVQLSDISIASTSRLRNPQVPNLAFGRTLSARTLSLKVDKERLELAGAATVGGIPATIKWVERFKASGPHARSYEAKTVLSEKQRKSMGLVDLAPYITGPVAVDLAIQQSTAGPKLIALKLALNNTALWLPGFNWRKPRGVDGVAWLSIAMAEDGGLTVRNFNVRTPTLAVSGGASFDRDHKFSSLEIKNFSLNRTKFVGTVKARPEGGYDVSLNGPELDARPFLKDEPDDRSPSTDMPPMGLRLEFDRVWFNEEMSANRLVADLVRDRSDWRNANVTAVVGEKQKVTFFYSGGATNDKVSVQSSDAGEVLRVLGVVETMRGGDLNFTVEKVKTTAGQPWKGNLQITDFVLVKAPLLARILTGASLTGIVDSLSGRGIRFAKLDIPLEIKDGVATVKNARTVGSELGFTAEGKIDTKKERIALKGTIVPAYTLNSLLGNIPLLGDLLTGKKGSGIFAATYRIDGPLKDPNITVNPLAALAPGFLRNLLGIFDGATQLNAPAPAAPN